MNTCRPEPTAVEPAAHAIAWGDQNVDIFSLYSLLQDDLSESEKGLRARMCARWVLDIESMLLRMTVGQARVKVVDAHERPSLDPFDSLVRDLDQAFQSR